MLQGVLISNGFLRTGKFVEHDIWLKEAAVRQGIALSLFDNTKLCRRMDNGYRKQDWDWLDAVDFVIFWDKDIPGGRFLEAVCREKEIPIYNSLDAIACCDHKFLTYEKVWRWNRDRREAERISLIPTVMAPMTYDNIGYSSLDFVEDVIGWLGLPMIVKECHGSFGMQVYRADTGDEVCALTEKLAGKPFLYQKYLAHTKGRDVRMQVVGNRVVAAMYRFSENGDFRANLTGGGSMKPYHPTERECRIGLQVCEILGLDFAGVDLLFDEEEQATVLCEANSNAHFKNIHTCTGVNVADCIMSMIGERCGMK